MATGIGETLVAARRQQGVALSDAAAETRVRESYLAALEAEDFAALGGDVYVKGFLRSYARFLRLDPEPLIAAYRAEYEREHDDISPLGHQPVAPFQRERSPVALIGIGVAVVVVGILALIGLLGGNDEDPEDSVALAPDPVETTAAVPTTEPTVEPTQQATEQPTDGPTEVLPADGVRLRLDLDGASWVRVTVDGEIQVEGEQPAGERLKFTAEESITVRIGDASAVRVRVNGQDRGTLGGPREVVEKTYTVDDAA
jgi:cytoskeleton protein RodZ